MATHDYVLANASGAAFRADLNNALAAIVSNNSSATEPATTYAYMVWYDTTNEQLKQRNAANDDWIIVQDFDAFSITADGNIGVGTSSPTRDFDLVRTASDADLRVESTSAGNDARLELIGDSAGASQIRFGDQDSVNSGLITYEHSSNSLNISTNGNAVATIDSGGLLYSVPTYDNTSTATTNYLRISASGEFFRSTSSIAYKTDVEDMEDKYADAILNLRPVWYRSTCKRDNPNHSHWGFIAEEVEQIDPRLCSFKNYETSIDEEGNRVVTPLDTPVVDGVDYASLTPLLLNLVKRQKAQIEALETRIAALEAN